MNTAKHTGEATTNMNAIEKAVRTQIEVATQPPLPAPAPGEPFDWEAWRRRAAAQNPIGVHRGQGPAWATCDSCVFRIEYSRKPYCWKVGGHFPISKAWRACSGYEADEHMDGLLEQAEVAAKLGCDYALTLLMMR